MEREHTIKILSENLEEIRKKFGVESLALFGSVARDEAKSGSDLDVLVTYINSPGLFGFLDLK